MLITVRIRQEGVNALTVIVRRGETSVINATYVGNNKAPSKEVTED